MTPNGNTTLRNVVTFMTIAFVISFNCLVQPWIYENMVEVKQPETLRFANPIARFATPISNFEVRSLMAGAAEPGFSNSLKKKVTEETFAKMKAGLEDRHVYVVVPETGERQVVVKTLLFTSLDKELVAWTEDTILLPGFASAAKKAWFENSELHVVSATGMHPYRGYASMVAFLLLTILIAWLALTQAWPWRNEVKTATA
jgi:hypothetical protein